MTSKKKSSASLLSKQAMGGVIGGEGYNFQDAYIVSRIPDWLRDPDFIQFLKEGSEDVDIRFKRDGVDSRTAIQVKNHLVSIGEFKDVLGRFKVTDEQTPLTYDHFTFACPGLKDNVQIIRRAVEQYRGARPIYDEARDRIIQNTKSRIATMVEELELPVSADFLIEKVYFDTDLAGLTSDHRLRNQFVGAVLEIERWQDAPPLAIRFAYKDFVILVNKSIRETIGREYIEDIIDDAINMLPKRVEEGIIVRMYHWEDQPYGLELDCDFVLDWSEHFDLQTRKVPSTETWENEFLPELIEIQKHIRSSTDCRMIRFRGSACLSAGIALGWAFKEVPGYVIEVIQNNESWMSNSTPSDLGLLHESKLENKNARDLRVEFSVIADVSRKVREYMEATGESYRASLTLQPSTGVGSFIDQNTALSFARQAKAIIRQIRDTYEADRVHIFFAGPLGLAVFFGQQLNRIGEVQCYEEQDEGGYQKSCLLYT